MRLESLEVNLTCVTNSTRVSAVAAIAEELQRILSAHAAVFARVGIASVDHVASIHQNLALAAIIFFLPVVRQLEVSINWNLSHASNEAVAIADDVVDFLRLRTTNVVPSAGDDAEQLLGSHWTLIDFQNQTVGTDGQDHDVPTSIIELLVVIVQHDSSTMISAAVEFFLVGFDLGLHATVFEEHFDVALRRELVINHQTSILVRSEGKRHVHGFNTFVTLQLGVRRAREESHGHDWRFRAVVKCVHLLESTVLTFMVSLFQLSDEVRCVQINVFDATGEVLCHDESIFPVWHAANEKHSIQIQLVEIAFDLSIDNDSIDGEQNVATIARNHNIVPDIVIE